MKNPLRGRHRKQGKSKGEEGYGDGRAVIEFGDDVLMDEDEMVAKLLACIEAPDYQPPTLPSVAADLLSLSQQPEVDFKDVIKLLEQDSLIAGRVLKLVQSPAYSGMSKLASLDDALVRLGLSTLRDLVMQIAMNMRVFKSQDYGDTMDLLRRHSMMTAHLAKVVCKYTAIEGEFAFMGGLLHDVGIAGTLLALSDRKGPKKLGPDLISIWPAVDRVHPRAAELMATQWGLPPDIKIAVANHHQVLMDGFAHPLSATICLAEDLAHDLGYGVIPKASTQTVELSELEKDCVRSHTSVDRSTPKTIEHAMTGLGLSNAQGDLIRADAEAIAQELDG
ncbi:MAG: HDOD domain-containing protein [Myxococcota bacterium]|nr:HDOD domain-containing protein [Myxococcota bacterium]